MENWQLGLLIIVAVVAGALVPAILQLALMLRSVRRVVEENQKDVRSAIAIVGANGANIQAFFDELKAASDAVREIRGTVKTATMVSAVAAPAIGAIVRAFQDNKR
jgi:hypothetical protein